MRVKDVHQGEHYENLALEKLKNYCKRKHTEGEMNSTSIHQTKVAVSWLVAILCIALLVGLLLLHVSIAGVHPAHTGIMIIAPPLSNHLT